MRSNQPPAYNHLTSAARDLLRRLNQLSHYHYGDPSCPHCDQLGILFDPLAAGRREGGWMLCSCLRAKQQAEASPWIYFDSELNAMRPCPTRPARNTIERIDNLTHNSGIPMRYRFRTLSDFANLPDLNSRDAASLLMALDYAYESISLFREKRVRGLYLQGGTGSGKTYLSCALLNDLLRLYLTPVRYAKISRDILGKLRASFNPNSDYYGEGRKIEEELASVAVLVIDDFGTHRESEFVHSVLYDLIDSRYENNLLTIITSNEPLDTWKGAFQGRIHSRMRSMCREVRIDLSVDLRPAMGSENED